MKCKLKQYKNTTLKLGVLIYLKLHLIFIFYFYNFFKLDYIFILNIKALFYLNTKLTLIILTFLNNTGVGSINCCDWNVFECIEDNFMLEIN